MSFSKLLQPRSWMNTQQTWNIFRGPVIIWTFDKYVPGITTNATDTLLTKAKVARYWPNFLMHCNKLMHRGYYKVGWSKMWIFFLSGENNILRKSAEKRLEFNSKLKYILNFEIYFKIGSEKVNFQKIKMQVKTLFASHSHHNVYRDLLLVRRQEFLEVLSFRPLFFCSLEKDFTSTSNNFTNFIARH